MKFPEELKYTAEHEWVRVEENNIAVVGITDFAQSELGDLVYIEIDGLDQELEKDAEFGTVEAVKTTSELFMPVSGKVIAFNPAIDAENDDNPGLINTDPYGEGWIVKIEMSNPEELESLLSAEDYQKEIA